MSLIPGIGRNQSEPVSGDTPADNNGLFVSARHLVVAQEPNKERFSMVLFDHPVDNTDTLHTALNQLRSETRKNLDERIKLKFASLTDAQQKSKSIDDIRLIYGDLQELLQLKATLDSEESRLKSLRESVDKAQKATDERIQTHERRTQEFSQKGEVLEQLLKIFSQSSDDASNLTVDENTMSLIAKAKTFGVEMEQKQSYTKRERELIIKNLFNCIDTFQEERSAYIRSIIASIAMISPCFKADATC